MALWDKIAAENVEDTDLMRLLAAYERPIYEEYARSGLWQIAVAHGQRNAALKRTTKGTADAHFAFLLALEQDVEEAREYAQCFAQQWRKLDPARVVWVSCLTPESVFDSKLLLELAQAAVRQNSMDWNLFALAMAQLRDDQAETALETLDSLGEGRQWLHAQLLRALVHEAMGERDRAQQYLNQAEREYEQTVASALDGTGSALRLGESVNKKWWEFAYSQVLRREARAKIHGETTSDDPWQRLILARGYWQIGENEKAEAELAALVIDQNNPYVWMARARLLGQWGKNDRAEADWQKVVDLAADDPMTWIHRGRWNAERGDQEKADADFAKAASLTPNELNRFLEAGWWVVGPYPPNVDEFCPPEIDPDPSKPVYTIDPKAGLSNEPVAWRSVPTDGMGYVDLGYFSKGKGLTSQWYALAYVYSPNERSVLLRGAMSHGPMAKARLWVNGVETLMSKDADVYTRVPIILRQGRNELLLKGIGRTCRFRIGDAPIDQAMTLLEQGRWFESATILSELSHEPMFSHLTTRRQLSGWLVPVLATAGDRKTYNVFAEEIFQRRPLPHSLGLQGLCTLPHPSFQMHANIAMSGISKFVKSNPAAMDWKCQASLINYRAGNFDYAQKYLDAIPQRNHGLNFDLHRREDLCLPLRALLCWQRKEEAAARQWLSRAMVPFDALSGADGRMLPIDQRGGFDWPFEVAQFCSLLCEAQREITGSDAEMRAKLRSFAQQQRDHWNKQDPTIAAFDHAVFTENIYRAQIRIARGKRLAELGRLDEAEADFNMAVQHKPDDPKVLAARAIFYADQGKADKAAADFDGALTLAKVSGGGHYWHGLPVYLAVAQYDDVLDRLETLRPEDGHSRSMRVAMRVKQGQLDAARRNAKRLASYEPNGFPVWRAAVALLHGDEQEFAAIQADRSSLGVIDKAFLLGLAPIKEPMQVEFLQMVHDQWEPVDRWPRRHIGQAQFRAGKLDEAVATLESSLDPRFSWHEDGHYWPLLAMAHHQLGNTDLAHRYLDMTTILMELYGQMSSTQFADAMSRPGGNPGAWLQMVVFHREAKRMIEAANDTSQNKSLGAKSSPREPSPIAKSKPKNGETAPSKPHTPKATPNAKLKEK